MAKNFRKGAQWICGKIIDQVGPLTYQVEMADGLTWKRHMDHLGEGFTHPSCIVDPEEVADQPAAQPAVPPDPPAPR